MVNVYLSGADARNAAADLWQQDQLRQLNDQFAPPPPPPPEPAQPPSPAPVEAAGVQGSSLPSPAAVGPGVTQPAPPTAVPPPSVAPNPTPDRNQIADQWQRSAIADAWEQNAISDVTKGVSQAGQGVQSALADVPQEARGLVSNYASIPGATAPQPAQQAPAGISGIPAPQPSQGQVATVTGGQPQDLQSYARQAAQRNGVDPDIFQRQIQQESGFRTDAVSPAGAVGVAQFMPATARGMGVDPTDPYASLDGAARLMSQNLKRYGGDYTKALAAYNAGPGNVDKYGGVPPFEETQRYVKTILAGGGGQQAASTDTQPISRPADDWLAIAKEQLGKPYIWGSAGGRSTFDPNAPGFDCSGFVSYVMKKAFGVDLPAFTGTAYTATRPLQEGETPGAAGQVAFYNMGQSDPHLQHIALSIGNGQVIQAGGRRNDVNTDVANDIGTPEWRVPVGIPGKLADAAQQVVGAGAAAAQVGQNAQQVVQQTAQGIISTVGNIGGALGTTASNIGSALTSPDLPSQIYQHSPIGAFNAGLQGIGQGVISPALEAISQPGGPLVGPRTAAAGVLENAASNVPSGVPVVGGALQAAANTIGGPTVIDQIGMVQDLANKYPSNVPGLPDVNRMTPQDQAQWSNLMIGVGGITGGEGAGGESLAPKAGNINLAKYPAEVQDVIQAAAPTIPESATRGVVPDAVVRDLAAMSGTSVPDIVANWKPGQAQNAETLLALRDSLAAQGRQVLDAQQALRANPDSVDAQAALVQALTQHRDLQTVVSGSTAEWGRAGRVFQQPVEGNIVALQQLQNLAQRTGQSVDQLARDLAGMDLNDPAQMAQVARVLNPPRLPPNEYLPTGPQPGQYGMFGQELPLGGPRPQGGEMPGPAGPQPGQLQFGSELPVGGPRPTGTEPLAVGPQPGQFQLESELPLGGPRPTGAEPPLPAGRMPGQQGLGIGEQYQQDLLAPRAGPFETPNVPTPAQTPEQADFLRRGMTYRALTEGTPLPDIPYQGPTAQNLQGAPSGRPSPPTATMRLPGFPNPDSATFPQLFAEYHRGNVISGPATMTHVIVNSFLSPAWSLATRGAADIAGGTASLATGGRIGLDTGFARVAGRGVGVVSALAQMGDDFAGALREFYTSPSNVANRIDNPLVAGFFRAQQATGAALHASFQTMAQGMVTRLEQSAMAGEQAAREGLSGRAWLDRIAELMNDPTREMVAKATDVGQRAALRGPAGYLQDVMQNVAKIPYLGNGLFPVVRIASQSLAQGIEKSPAGLIGTGVDVARGLAGKGPYAEGFNQLSGAVTPLGDRLTNNLAGTALTLWLIQKAQDGTITGAGPQDPRQRQTLQSQGWQPYSVFIPGRGYVDYRFLGPLAIPMALAGSWHDAQNYGKPMQPGTSGTDRAGEFAGQLARQVGSYLVSHTGLQTLADLSGALQGDPQALANWPGNLASGFVPFSAVLRGAANATDPYLRRTQPGDIGQIISAGIPGLRENTPVRQDVLGQPEANPQSGLGVFSPRTGTGQASPLLTMLSQAGINLSSTPPKEINYSGRQIQLTPDEQQQRQALFGQRLQQTMQGYLKSEKFQALPPEQQYKALEPVVRAASTYADQRVIAEMPAADRRARMASSPRAYGAGVVPYVASSGGLAGLIARQSAADADAAHQRLLTQFAGGQQPAPVQPAA